MARIRLLAGAALLVAAGGCGFRTGLGVPGAFEFVSVHGPASLVQGQTQAMDVVLVNRSSVPARPPSLGVSGAGADSLSVAFDPASVADVAPGAQTTIHPHLSASATANPQAALGYRLAMLDSGSLSDPGSVSILRKATLEIELPTVVGPACTGVSTATPSAGATELQGLLRNVGDSPAILGADAGPQISIAGSDVTGDFQAAVTGTAANLAGTTIAPQTSVAFDWLLHAAAGTPLTDGAQVAIVADATDGTTGAPIQDPSGEWSFAVLSPVHFTFEVTTAPATVSRPSTGVSLVLTATQAGTSHGTVTGLAPKFFIAGADVSTDYTPTTVTSTPFAVTAGETGIGLSWTVDVSASATTGSASVFPVVTGTDDGCGIPIGSDASSTAAKSIWQVQ